MPTRGSCFALCILALVAADVAKTREQKVREDRQKVEAEGFWIYNDLPRAFETAEKTGKPLLVVLRCIPCEECVKLDDELVDRDPVLRPLMEKFVCVRVVGTNGLDLSLFQYDTDQSFAVFLLNADRTIYGRFGTRSHRTDWIGDVSLEGLAKALRRALALHADYPKNKPALAGKTDPAPEFARPELYPSLKDKYTSTLNYEGNVVKSCIHCHQIGDAQRQFYRDKDEPIPEAVLFPYPHPRAVGLVLAPNECATVREVTKDSAAERSGFRAGDVIDTLEGQPLLSMADVQWVLQRSPAAGGELKAEVIRDGRRMPIALSLPAGWRQADNISWRATAWGLRRMATGGLLLKELSAEKRVDIDVSAKGMALRVEHVGQYGPHAAAKQAGFQEDDIFVEFDGRTDLNRETDLIRHALTAHRAGEQVPVVVLRKAQRVKLMLPMQK
ncbi:MAG TPA: Trx7/PDZ domain-containing (seleno)protein [Planctomycetaceae bacterium]|nr:Trx7/PDZ domain-containing (seleno)protein [Planctomycetaceae bacterium]